jgi:hypothetical protein
VLIDRKVVYCANLNKALKEGHMKHRRMAWAAGVVAISTLGLTGIFAEGCGGDDTATPGSGGSAGSGGQAGTAGTGGTGGAKADAGKDAQPDVNYQALCSGGVDSGSSCGDMCICTNCAQQAVACFGDPKCRNLVDCANRHGCNNPDIATATACAQTNCPTELGAAGLMGIGEATALSMCVTAAMCDSKCAPEGGTGSEPAPDAPTSDGPRSDAPTTDGPRSDAPADAPRTDTGEASSPEAAPGDAPSESTTIDTGLDTGLNSDTGSDATPD